MILGGQAISVRAAAMTVGALVTALLLALCFAPFEMADAAWVALVPLLMVAAYAEPARIPKLAWLAGSVFWLISLFWLTRVTYAGWFLLALYCGAYAIPFLWVVSWWFRRFGVARFLPNLGFMVVATASWVGLEYLRGRLFTGFPWNPLGVSQFTHTAFIQHASWGGVYAVSAMLVWTNAALALTVLRYVQGHARLGRKPHPEIMLAMGVIVIAFVTGNRMARQADDVSPRVMRLALIQPSIPQDNKWSSDKVEMIYDRLRELTASAILFTNPDLVVWPETALPYDVRLSDSCYALVNELVRMGAPILVGSMDAETFADRPARYYNSSFLFDTNGVIIRHYEKRHLVLFGEYVPWHEHITFITAMTPIMESFSPGNTSTVFRAPGVDVPFSVLICFEDTLAYLGRESVRNGARLLINQTNDAWFDPLWGSRQHLALSVFRAVENRVPLVRAANTGYSCAVDARGALREVLTGEQGRHDGPGFQLVSVEIPPDRMPLTFYTRHGDVFAWLCCAVGAVALALAYRDRRRVDYRQAYP